MGAAFTFTITLSVALQRPNVAVTVYVVVTTGFATGLGIEVLLNPVDGVHAYCIAFDTKFNCVDVPSQIVASICGVKVRSLVIATVAVVVAVQPKLSLIVI